MRILISFYVIYCIAVATSFKIAKKWIYLPGIAITFFAVSAAVYLRLQAKTAIYALCMLWISVMCVKLIRDVFERYRLKAYGIIDEKESAYEELVSETKNISRKKNAIDDDSLALARIYGTVKAMSGMLKADDMVEAFAVSLNENFSFSRAYLVIFGAGTNPEPGSRAYLIDKGNAKPEEMKESEEGASCKIVRYAMSRKYKHTIPSADLIRQEIDAGATSKKLDVIPLIAEGRTIAVTLIGDLSGENSENLSLLISQLAMELKKASLYEDVERLSFTDGLTQIYLRRYFTERASEEIKRAERLKLRFGILMIDIDHFKRCNDTYGHMVGDVVLKEVASEIKASIRGIDLVARHGGEEFTVMLPDTDKESALQVAERIRKRIEDKTIVAYDENLRVTASVGVSVYPNDGDRLDDLTNKADEALYRSKKNGRNLVTAYS